MEWDKLDNSMQVLFDKLNTALKRFGYVAFISRRYDHLGKYTLCTPYKFSTRSPWFEDWFQTKFQNVKGHSLVNENACYNLYEFGRYCSHLDGDFAECGVYKGGTAYMLADVLMSLSLQSKSLHLFDTFSGMPSTADKDPSGHKQGEYGDITLEEVKAYLNPFPFIIFHPGFIPETFRGLEDNRYAFVHVDVDLYQSTKDSLSFFYDRMIKGGIILFDEYGKIGYERSERLAVDEFFQDKPEIPISLRTGQCFIIKL